MVDTGTMIAIDPGYLFSRKDWEKVIKCAYPKKRKKPSWLDPSYKECLREAIERRAGRKGRVGGFAVIGTGGDGEFPVRCKRGTVEIKSVHACNLED